MELIKYNRETSCSSCINYDHCCDIKMKCFKVRGEYYANKDQIESLIEEAEKRYRENGGLVVCNHAEECVNNECTFKIPYKHYYLEPIQWRCQTDEETQCKTVAFRGKPTKEEEGHKKNRFESQEYRLLKSVNFDNLLHTDIDPKIFKELCLEDGFMSHNGSLADVIYDQSNFDYALEELVRLGFIEKVVHDPVVGVGDTFKKRDNSMLYRIMSHGNNEYVLCNLNGKTHYGGTREIAVWFDIKLSVFTGHNNIHKFKPVKIKITEVEEG